MLPLTSATQVLLLAAGLAVAANTAFDSQGKLFQVTFVRNVNADMSQQNATSLSLRLINPQTTLATVTVYDFQYDDARNFTPTVQNVQVQPLSDASVNISPSMMWDYVQSGIKQVEYNKRVTIESDQDIQVYAINEQISGYNAGSGDAYMVLPNSMAGLDYVVSFPDVSQQVNGWSQFAVIHLLPTLDAKTNVTVWISAVSKGGQVRQDHVTLVNDNTTSFHYYAQAGGDYPDTVYLHGDGSFQIVAGVTCATVGTGGSKCDHIEWMPSPAINKVCSPGFLEATYPVVPLSGDAMYSVGMPNDACTGIWEYTIYDSGNTYCEGNITADTYQGPESTLQRCNFTNSGMVNFVADAATFIVARFETSKDPGSGMFADNVPELTQFLLPDTSTLFFARNPGDILVYILLDGGDSTATLDGNAVTGTAITVEKRNYIYGNVSLPAAGVHKFWSSTNYTLLVYGILQTGFSYGYVPAVMQQRLVMTGPTSIPQPTTTSTTISTTTTTTTTTATTTTTTATTATTTTTPTTTTTASTSAPWTTAGGSTPSSSTHLSTPCPTDSSVWSRLFLDILFVVDTSAGVSQGGLKLLKAVFYSMISQLTVGQSNNQTRVGFLRFSDKAELVYNFTAFNTTTDAINGLEKFLADETNFHSTTANLAEGISTATTYIDSAGRPGFGQVMVVLSSQGVNCSDTSNGNVLACQYAAVFLNGPHREIFSIAIESVDQSTVVDLGNSPCTIFNGSDPNLLDLLLTQFSYANCYCKGSDYVQVRGVNATDCRRYAECVWAGDTKTLEAGAEFACDDTLAIVYDQNKQNFLNYFNDPSGNKSYYPYWIGLKGAYPNLQWQDGTPLSDGDYTNWAIQPTPGQQTCVWMQPSGLNRVPKWYSQNCSQTAYFICQKPACSPSNINCS